MVVRACFDQVDDCGAPQVVEGDGFRALQRLHVASNVVVVHRPAIGPREEVHALPIPVGSETVEDCGRQSDSADLALFAVLQTVTLSARVIPLALEHEASIDKIGDLYPSGFALTQSNHGPRVDHAFEPMTGLLGFPEHRAGLFCHVAALAGPDASNLRH